MSEKAFEGPEHGADCVEFADVYKDYTHWLPEEEVGYCGFNLIPLERYVDESEPNADAINAAEDLRISRSYMDYIVSLPEAQAAIAAKHLLHIDNWQEVMEELEAGITV
jgi:hypothetical protein